MGLLDGKRRRKGHDEKRQGRRFLAWALLFLSVPPRSFPAPHSQPTGGVEAANIAGYHYFISIIQLLFCVLAFR